jgi:hypothetical protein
MEGTVVTSLVSVAVGWLLAQGTTLAKDWWAAKKLRAGLLIELHDIQDQLRRVQFIHTRQLQIFALNGMEPSAALPIQNMFFKQYYREAFSRLNREQRISYQLIHSSLENLNYRNEELAKFAGEAYKDLRMSPDDKKKVSTIEIWGDRVIVLYKTTMDIRWHIDYHIHNPKCPTFDIMGPMHESYVKFQQELDEEVAEIMKKARELKREDFERIYDEKVFFPR